MRRLLPLVAAAALGLGLHVAFTEWRTTVYPAAEAEATRGRVLVTFRSVLHSEGNAGAWDAADRRIRAYHSLWERCFESAHPDPGPAHRRCVAERVASFGPPTPTSRAVAIGECARKLFGGIPHQAALEACVGEAGGEDLGIPRWTFDRIGPRFEAAYVTETALRAEQYLDSDAASRALGWAGGMLLPAALLVRVAWRVHRQAEQGRDT
jgi:hypothetical protein